ncbi:MAG: YaiO family outer membrane beta-barrel protein [Candidatus Ratteibacteria bacterium]|nr:YaiO family outer membrane beta-barrel protein [Candidatus Ratteibacteria bacterium]
MKIYSLLVIFLIILISPAASSPETSDAESSVKEKEIKVNLPKKGKFYLSSYYDYGWVNQNAREGRWTEWTNTISYTVNDYFTPYAEVNNFQRFDSQYYTLGLGSLLRFEDNSSWDAQIVFGSDIDYVYSFQGRIKYEHRMFGNYFWTLGYRYSDYADNDVFITYPGLIYYFGDNFLSATYNNTFTETRGVAHSGTLKGYFVLNENLNFWLGTAAGERLYDIDETLNASAQSGYIIFTGLDYSIFEAASLILGFSYSQEEPDFIKRSLQLGLSFKF